MNCVECGKPCPNEYYNVTHPIDGTNKGEMYDLCSSICSQLWTQRGYEVDIWKGTPRIVPLAASAEWKKVYDSMTKNQQ